ncbi:MAG: hypothetical protein JWO46_3328 [Nocardioidaceae bacterium]|nr:hypothetical protein [Nocardioidaceae bacterium]
MIGLLQVAGVTVVLSGGLWLLFSGLIARTGMRLGRLLHLVPQLPPPGPLHPSLETVAADLHRIRHDLETRPPGLSMAKRLGTLQAYDDRLLDACRALEVPDTLAGLPEGIDRDTERLRVESRLEEAGLRVSHGGSAPTG